MHFLAAEGVTGKALLELDKDSLKEAGIVALGRRLEMMNEIKALKGGLSLLSSLLYIQDKFD